MTARTRKPAMSADERRLSAAGWMRCDMPDTGDGYGRWTSPHDGRIELEHLTHRRGWVLHVPGRVGIQAPLVALMMDAKEYACR